MTQPPFDSDPSRLQHQAPAQIYAAPPISTPPYQAPPTNALAIVSLISVFFVSLAGIIFGHIALSQIKRTGERGRGLALAGTILGYVFVAGKVIIIGIVIAFFGFFGYSAVQAGTSYSGQGDTSELYMDPGYAVSPEFCAALDSPLEATDEAVYLSELLAVTDDGAFAEGIKNWQSYADLDPTTLSDSEYAEYVLAQSDWAYLRTDMAFACSF